MTTSNSLGWQGCLNALAGQKNLGSAAAACVYAGLPIGAQDVLGALNVKAGNGRLPSGFRDLAAVCNQLASTSNLDPLEALHVLLGMT